LRLAAKNKKPYFDKSYDTYNENTNNTIVAGTIDE